MAESCPASGPGARSEPQSRWALLLPWAVLPVALAIITLVDWRRRSRRQTRPKEAE